MISEETMNKLENVLREIVIDSEGIWRDKAKQIRVDLSEDAQSHLDEFVGWFDEVGL